jgi:ferrous iron transport protein B
MSETISIALAGNPNSGKSTIFNALTGARQHVGNYPGVTVEKMEGVCRYKGREIKVVDLPGTYSLTAYSIEEVVARNFILDEYPDVVVDIVDASNLERNLYLATQLMEIGVRLVLAFNMSDVAKNKGLQFDIELLSKLFGVRIIETVANKRKGIFELVEAVFEAADSEPEKGIVVHYGDEIEQELSKIEDAIEAENETVKKYGKRYLSLKLLEQDKQIQEVFDDDAVLEIVEESTRHIEEIFGDNAEIITADRRYGFISGACQEAVKSTVEARHDVSDKVDAVVLHRLLGLPIFIGLMYLVFQLTFSAGAYPVSWLEVFFEWVGSAVSSLWPAGSDSALRSLLVDGVIGGVGGVVVFLPNILLLFLAIAFLEDTGYMARAAFLMDTLMHKIGLHGKSFIPMLIGFGCSVPAIMATRILENRRNRLTTILVIPLMSCGARLPIYTLIISAFIVEKWQGPVMWLVYVIGIVLAIFCAKLLRKTLFRGETIPFVMELPPYRMPTFKGLAIHMWDRGWMYLRKAGTIILAISILLWVATSYPKADEERLSGLSQQQVRGAGLRYSAAGRIGRGLEPVIKPLGFDWKVGTALIGAVMAKEVFVSQLGIVYSLGDVDEGSEALRTRLRADYSVLQGFCIMLFCLISAPCMATLAITRKETGSWGWAAFQFLGLTVLGYVVTLIVYQMGSLLS